MEGSWGVPCGSGNDQLSESWDRGVPGEVPPLRRGKTLPPRAGYPRRSPEASFWSLFHDIVKVWLLSRFVTIFGKFSDIFWNIFVTQDKTRRQDKTRHDKTKYVNSSVFHNMNHKVCFFDM